MKAALRSTAGGAGIAALAVVLIGSAARLQAVRERRYPFPAGEVEQSLYLTSGTAARRVAGAYAALAADLYWIRAIQHYGATKVRLAARRAPEPSALIAAPPAAPPDEYRLLYPLLDLTTSLDPQFNIAYRFGAVFLAEPYPAGPGRPDLAIALLEKGLRQGPDKWEYMQDIGFVHYWYDHDYRAAAQAFQKASEINGAPWWLRSLAATTLATGGDRRSSKLMWEAIRQSADNDWLRRDAERRLLQLRALDEIDALQRAVDGYTRRAGQPPSDWNALVRAGILRGVPIEPGGTPYELGPGGRVRLPPTSPLYPLPAEPAAQAAVPPA
jgi:tetratricopeptide (TPR) repeat protein